jgi:hypothetical protein
MPIDHNSPVPLLISILGGILVGSLGLLFLIEKIPPPSRPLASNLPHFSAHDFYDR